MHKSCTGFFVVSLVAAVLSTGCSHKQQTPVASDTGTAAASVEAQAQAQRETSDVDVTSTKWSKVESGPVTVVGLVGVGRFDGEAACFATSSPACGNASTPSANQGTRVFACTGGTCAAENGGRVASGQILCCGPVKGNGGKLRVAYTK